MSRVPDRAIFFDIETVPTSDEEVKKAALARRMWHQAKDNGEDFPTTGEEAVEKLAVTNGIYSEIVSIAWAAGMGPVKIFTARDYSEREIIKAFEEALAEHVHPKLIGYNIFSFDLKMIFQRAHVLGGRRYFPTLFNQLPAPDVAPWQAKDTVDLAHKWQGVAGGKVPQYGLAVALGIVSYEEAAKHGSGGDVLRWVREGNWDAVIDHNVFDIEVTRALFRRIVAHEEVVLPEAGSEPASFADQPKMEPLL